VLHHLPWQLHTRRGGGAKSTRPLTICNLIQARRPASGHLTDVWPSPSINPEQLAALQLQRRRRFLIGPRVEGGGASATIASQVWFITYEFHFKRRQYGCRLSSSRQQINNFNNLDRPPTFRHTYLKTAESCRCCRKIYRHLHYTAKLISPVPRCYRVLRRWKIFIAVVLYTGIIIQDSCLRLASN